MFNPLTYFISSFLIYNLLTWGVLKFFVKEKFTVENVFWNGVISLFATWLTFR